MTSRPRNPSTPGRGRGKPRKRPANPQPVSRTSTRSTAREAVPAAPDAGRSARARLTGRAAILLLVMAVLAVSYASSARAWLRQRGEINELSAQIAEQKADIAGLEQAQRRWQDPAFIKTQARLRFGWVMPGETGYRVIDDDGNTLTDGTSELSDPVEPTSPEPSEWWDTVWGSVTEAGADPSAEAPEPTGPERQPIDRIGGDRRPKQGPGSR